MAGHRGNPGCYPRHLGKPKGLGNKECMATGFLRRTGQQVQDVRQGLVAHEFADITPGFGTHHPQDRVTLGVLDDPKPIPGAVPKNNQDRSKQDLAISDQEILASIREGRAPRTGY